MARTVDHISDGRLILGIGSGWFEQDYDEYGYEFGTAGGRLDALGRDLPRIEAGWAQLNPAPTRDDPGAHRRRRREARRCGSSPSTPTSGTASATPRRSPTSTRVLDEWCAPVGRDPAAIERSAGVAPTPGRMPEQVASYATTPSSSTPSGTRLFTVGVAGADPTTSANVRDLVAVARRGQRGQRVVTC